MLVSVFPAYALDNQSSAPAAQAKATLNAVSYYKVTSDSLNVRENSTGKSDVKVLLKLKKNALVTRLDSVNYKGGGDTWYKVQTVSGVVGFVCSDYVSKVKSPNFSRLTRMKPSKGNMYPAFSPDWFEYFLYLDDSDNSFDLSFDKSLATAEVKVNDTVVDGSSVSIPFSEGSKVTIAVTAGAQKSTYTIVTTHGQNTDSLLSSLSFKDLKLTPEFNPEVYEYSASVPYKTIETTAAIKKNNYYSDIEYYVGGEKSADGFLPLMVGSNQFKIKCISPRGDKSATYTVNITRAAPASGEAPIMSALERRIVEQAFQLLPERHPFVLAYEQATGRDIKSYHTYRNGKRISGVAFEYGGSGSVNGFSSRWWNKTSVARYPVGGMDCAEYIHWVYQNIGYDVPHASNALFLSGVSGVTRSIKGVRTHKVIPSLKDAKIGDVAYNSEEFGFGSGHGNHTSLFLGTARKLGIGDAIRKYYRKFPIDAYLVIDIGWADGVYYHNMIRKVGTKGRDDLCGVGVQFFSSIRGSNGKYLYKSPYKTGKSSFSWYDSKSKQTYRVSANIERNHRPYQYKWNSSVKYVMNLSRPIKRND
jgi:uncharacterized protein YgiM (DUF1202 family)